MAPKIVLFLETSNIEFFYFQTFHMIYNQMHATNMAKHKCKHYLSIKENHQLHLLMHSFLFLLKRSEI
jgi:hypothetical protein